MLNAFFYILVIFTMILSIYQNKLSSFQLIFITMKQLKILMYCLPGPYVHQRCECIASLITPKSLQIRIYFNDNRYIFCFRKEIIYKQYWKVKFKQVGLFLNENKAHESIDLRRHVDQTMPRGKFDKYDTLTYSKFHLFINIFFALKVLSKFSFTFTVLSQLELAKCSPSGLKVTASTQEVWPDMVHNKVPSTTLNSFICPSSDPK